MNATLTAKQVSDLRALFAAETVQHVIAQGYATTVEGAERELMKSEVSDLYKSVNGFRPRFIGDYTFEQLGQLYFDLVDQHTQQMEDERQLEADHEKAVTSARTPHTWTLGEVAGL